MNLELLDRLPGQDLAQLIRGSDESPETIQDWYGLETDGQFSFAPGPVFVTTEDGGCLGLNSDAAQCSLIAWDAKVNAGPSSSPYHLAPPDAFPSQGRILSVRLFREQPRNSRFDSLPRLPALLILLASGQEIAFVHGLHDDSDDFQVILADDILPQFSTNWELVHAKTSA